MFIAKNKDGQVNLYYKKPKQKDDYWLSVDGKYFPIDGSAVKLDNEPLEVRLVTDEVLQSLYEFKEWLYGKDCDGRISAVRDKFEQLRLDKV